jgi:hypothetical protein
MSATAPTREALAALVAESRVVRAEAYALLDALRAANFRLQELIASHDRLERAGRVQLRSLSSENALDRLKAAIAKRAQTMARLASTVGRGNRRRFPIRAATPSQDVTDGPRNEESTRNAYALSRDLRMDRRQQLGMLTRLQQQLVGARASAESESGLIDRLSDDVGRLQWLLSRTGV